VFHLGTALGPVKSILAAPEYGSNGGEMRM
jgi:hypothetical protein